MRFVAYGSRDRRSVQATIEASDSYAARKIAEGWSRATGTIVNAIEPSHALLTIDDAGRVLISRTLDGKYEPLDEGVPDESR